MTEKNIKIKIVLTFGTMLVLAMLLQSIVVMFLGVRSSIREDVTGPGKPCSLRQVILR